MTQERRQPKWEANHASLLVMIKMALANGEVSREEQEMLLEWIPTQDQFSSMLEEAKQAHLEELIEEIHNYADKFFVGLRAYTIANVDKHFDVEEEKLFKRLLVALKLEPEDQRLIVEFVDQVSDVFPHPAPKRVEELYQQSSFAQLPDPQAQ